MSTSAYVRCSGMVLTVCLGWASVVSQTSGIGVPEPVRPSVNQGSSAAIVSPETRADVLQNDPPQPPERYFTQKGSTFISGSGSISMSRQMGETITLASIGPNVLFFVSSHFCLGFDMSLQYQKFGDLGSKTFLGLGPKIGIFWGGPQSTVYPTVGVGVNFINLVSSSRSTSVSTTGWALKGGCGVVICLGEHLGLPIGVDVVAVKVGAQKDFEVTYALGFGLAGLLY